MILKKIDRQFVVFVVIGIANTSIHLSIVASLVEIAHIDPVFSNGLAFFIANLFSFWANSKWTFRTALEGHRYIRFMGVSLLGLGVSMSASALAKIEQWHYMVGVFISFAILPLITFLCHKYWTWRHVEQV